MANETAVTGPLEAGIRQAATAATTEAVETALDKESGGFDVTTEPTAAGTRVNTALTNLIRDGALLTMLQALDARYAALFAPKTTRVTQVNAATYDLQPGDEILQCDYTGVAAITNLRLMTSELVVGRAPIIISDTGKGAATKNITITTEGEEHINGADTYVIDAAGGWVMIVPNADGLGWIIAAKDNRLTT